MTLEELKKMKRGFTHSGLFHADDVFASAFLKIINPEIIIERGFEVPDNYDGIVFDIGMGEFDHHQSDNELRENGIPYASFGKLWRAFAPLLYGERVYEKIDYKFIESLDLCDNTGRSNALADAVSLFNPLWDTDSNGDKEFEDATSFAKIILEKLIAKEISYVDANKLVMDAYNRALNKEIIILDRYIPFKEILPDTKAVYVIFPSNRGGFCVQAITKNSDTKELKKAFPDVWRQTLPSYVNFCHNSLFLISTDTLENALKAAEYSLERVIK
jgi:uncharacterized UPF0160 family protein